ncbi:hypothetical protein Ocin01_06808 [Orchesella cincta]|uniref:Ig-like domain-containing protein n=1 Tax=Orchesella cincta TaxID=48709 RepID=A0A1D2N3N7_ORCCI|nr:hypothetical protein Ocin01_06808 [Orchesella cincta]
MNNNGAEASGLVIPPVALSLSPSGTLSEVSGLAGQSVRLACQLSHDSCGSIHSIKWYRADRRVYIFSESASISRAEDDLADRKVVSTP